MALSPDEKIAVIKKGFTDSLLIGDWDSIKVGLLSDLDNDSIDELVNEVDKRVDLEDSNMDGHEKQKEGLLALKDELIALKT